MVDHGQQCLESKNFKKGITALMPFCLVTDEMMIKRGIGTGNQQAEYAQ